MDPLNGWTTKKLFCMSYLQYVQEVKRLNTVVSD